MFQAFKMPNAPLDSVAPRAPAATSSHGRLIEVLDALVRRVDGEPWGVRELASELDESRSTINRILAALVDRDFAIEEGAGKYRIGPRFKVLMLALNERSALLDTARRQLTELAQSAKQAALLSVYVPHLNGYYVHYCGEAQATLSFRPQIGAVYPLGFGDIGRGFNDFLKGSPDAWSADVSSPMPSIAESEFPPAVCILTRRLVHGLVVSVSLHDLGGGGDMSAASMLSAVESIVTSLQESFHSVTNKTIKLVCGDDSSILARLEAILQLLCAEPNGYKCTIGIAAELQCNAATAKKIVESTSQAHLLVFREKELYPGARLYQWSALLNNRASTTAKLCRSVMESLVKETGETVAFLSYDAISAKAHFLEVFQGWRPIQYKLETGVDVPLYAGGAGKAVLAHLDPAFAEGLTLKKITDTTIVSHSELRKDLLAIRERGWSVGDGERVLGAFGIGVPFFIDGRVAGSISATIPQYRKQDCDVPALIEQMKLASERIGRLLSLGVSQV